MVFSRFLVVPSTLGRLIMMMMISEYLEYTISGTYIDYTRLINK